MDLTNCRLVSQFWWRICTNLLRTETRPVAAHSERQIENFLKFWTERRLPFPLPFNSYALNFRTNCSKCSDAVRRILFFLKQQTQTQLTIYHHCCFSRSFDRNGHLYRQKALNFVELLTVKFYIVFDNRFTPNQVNMAEIVEQNPSLQSITLSLRSTIDRMSQQSKVVATMRAVCSPTNKLAKLCELHLHLVYVENECLRTLRDWSPPLRLLEIGTFELTVDDNSATPESLASFLGNIAGTLRVLKLRVRTDLSNFVSSVL